LGGASSFFQSTALCFASFTLPCLALLGHPVVDVLLL
jgi:hypothetical protein